MWKFDVGVLATAEGGIGFPLEEEWEGSLSDTEQESEPAEGQ